MFLNWFMNDDRGCFDMTKLCHRLLMFGLFLLLMGWLTSARGADVIVTPPVPVSVVVTAPVPVTSSSGVVVPGVTTPATFRNAAPVFNPTHRCPTCGLDSYPATYVKTGVGPVPGTHLHTCPRDGTVWYH